MRNRMRRTLLICAIATTVVLAVVTLAVAEDEGVQSAPAIAQEISGLAQSLEEAGFSVKVAPVEQGGASAYRLTSESTTWQEYIVRTDDILRQVSLAKAAGSLSRDYVDVGVSPPVDLGAAKGSEPSRESSLFLRINGIEPGPWDVDPEEKLAEVRSLLIQQVNELAAKCGLEVADVQVSADKGTQVLKVHLIAERKGDGQKLLLFRDELWGRVVPQLNASIGAVGLGYMQVEDASGSQLVFEVSDFMIGWTHSHSEIDYPPAD